MQPRARLYFALLLLAVLTIAGCKDRSGGAEPAATEVPSAVGAAAPLAAGAVVESQFGTKVKDRAATLGLLNKRNNLEQDVVLKTGESKRIGNVVLKLASCEKTLPWENPPETGAFVQVFVEERAGGNAALAWRKVFSGWLFKNSPSLNVVEHPVYDVWVKDCAMKFPGEEEDLSADASKAAKAVGNAKRAKPPGPAAVRPSAPDAPHAAPDAPPPA